MIAETGRAQVPPPHQRAPRPGRLHASGLPGPAARRHARLRRARHARVRRQPRAARSVRPAAQTATGRVYQVLLTVAPDITARSMDLEWGSRAWYDSYVRRRPRVEGANGILKHPAFSPLAHMNIRVRGRAKVGLFTAFAVAITNLRATDRWRTELARVRTLNEAIGLVKRSRAPRRAHTLDKLLAPKHRQGSRAAAARAP
jgi:hypothetical protein